MSPQQPLLLALKGEHVVEQHHNVVLEQLADMQIGGIDYGEYLPVLN